MQGSQLPPPSPPFAPDSLGSRLWQSDLWEALALALVGGMLLRFRIRQELTLLIHENYLWLATLSGCLLLGLGGIQLIRILGGRSISIQSHQSLLPPRVGAGILLVAALLGFIVVPRPLSSQTALNRGVEQNLSLARESPEAFQPRVDPGSRGLIDWIRTLDVYPDPGNYIGQKVNVDGFVIPYDDLVAANPEGSRQGESSEGMFWLARFLISCCAADAYPVGLPVIWPQATSLEADQWLAVTGTMILDERGGSRRLAIRADSVTPIEPPINPYAY
ncbi:MAG: TIGR03943 family protein [Synechococcaceae cyanobacterium SM2_3_2]|nr:TIGR03943 family protein [Synechococcaceae cyanobacterium SM2_3_2]